MGIQILTIDDRSDLKEAAGVGNEDFGLLSISQEEVQLSDEETYLYDLAKEIREITNDGKWVLFINIFLSCKDDDFHWQQDHAGIALIKFLRILGVYHHVVLLTPYSLEFLLQQDPGNLILSSKGVTLTKPVYNGMYMFCESTEVDENDSDDVNTIFNLEELADKEFDEDLKPYLLVDFELPQDERHNWANWWGIVQLTDVHRDIFSEELMFSKDGEECEYPSQANFDLKLKSLQNQKAFWLYRHEVDFAEGIQEAELNQLKDKLIELKETSEDLEKKIKGEGKYKKISGYSLVRYYQKIIDENKGDYKWDKSIRPEIESKIKTTEKNIEENKKELNKINKEKRAIESKMYRIQHRTIESEIPSFKNKISEFRFQQSESKPKILYIDDKANEGWSEIFQILIYGETKEKKFKPISGTNYKIIKSEIEELNPNLILLDLRLKGESGTQRNVEGLSGAKILKDIREDYPGLPIMMTTASNKAWSYETLIRLGADCFWSKEGIDISATLGTKKRASYSVNNYESFLKYVNVLNSERYQFLNRFGSVVNEMSEKRYEVNWWWKDHTWKWKNFDKRTKKYIDQPPYHTNDFFKKEENFNDFFDRLFIGISMYRLYLQNLLHTTNEIDIVDEARIISYLGHIVELVHIGSEGWLNSSKIGFYFNQYNTCFTPQGRFDFFGWCLYNFRNKSSHVSAKYCKTHYLQAFISGLLTWLYSESYPEIDKDEFSKKMDHYMNKDILVDFECWFEEGDSHDASSILKKIIGIAGTNFSEKYLALMGNFISDN